jgi:hypothetical protein
MTFEEFYAEITTQLSSFAETGSIDKISVKTAVITCLRQMGNNITELRETVVDVKNSKAVLPENFKSLKLALKLNPEAFSLSEDNLRSNYLVKQKIENPAWYNQVTGEYETTCDSKLVTEVTYYGGQYLKQYYTPEWLSLTKGIKKEVLSVDCQNMHPSIRNNYPHEINITSRTLNANFKEGQIYLRYNALPTDENDDLLIPEITTGDLVEYVKIYVKSEIAETLIINNQNAQGLKEMLPLWIQRLPMLKASAMRECRFGSLNKGWETKFANQNRRYISIFNLPKF